MNDQSAPPDDRSPHPADRDESVKPSSAKPSTQTSQTSALATMLSQLPAPTGETSSSAIAARARAEVEARFLYAAKFPRVFQTARRRILDACKRPVFAAKARYAKPVGGKQITGLSIRFAEEARVNWGNLDVSAMIVFDDAERRIYRVQGVDLETNATDAVDVIIEKFVERRNPAKGSEILSQRLNTKGELVYRIVATEDDILVKANNQVAKHRRNVILTLIPSDIKEEAEAQIIDTQRTGDAADPAAAVKKIVDAFWSKGVTPAQLIELLGHPIEQINPAELVLLRTYYQTLDDAEGTWADIFEAHTAGKKPTETTTTTQATAETKGTSGLRERVAEKKAGGATPPADKSSAPATATAVVGACEFCGANIGKGEKHKPDCEALK